eukprot:1158502-Pelagomonas_calceolata.AAC.9
MLFRAPAPLTSTWGMAKPLLAYPRPSSLSQRHPATPSVRAFEARHLPNSRKFCRDASPAPERSGSQSKEDSGREWAEERKRLRAERVQNALQAGRMGLNVWSSKSTFHECK